MGRLDGKVAMITGAARGQGRSHAVAFAREGAEIVACDVCAPMPAIQYPASTPEDLAETGRRVEELDRRCIAAQADARDSEAMRAVVDSAIEEFGHIDILFVNHGIAHTAMWDATTDEIWDTAIGVILTGTWRTTRLVIPHMIKQGGGSIIFTTSAATQTTYYGLTHYTAAKAGVAGLMRTLSAELAQHSIRVNSIAPNSVATPMCLSQVMLDLFTGRAGSTQEDARPIFESLNLLPVAWLDSQDISNAGLFLASDEARYVTGIDLAVDAGTINQPPGIPPAANEELARLRQLLAAKE
jgi:SDR family mycofactocin-dependent oxidoreductase